MKNIERYLCHECRKTLQASGLLYKRVPYSEGSQEDCDWCGRMRPGVSVKIYFGRNKR